MSLANPMLNPPLLTTSSQVHSTHPSRSPSTSPIRRRDPLLRDLSPTKTLHAFSHSARDERNNVLARSIQHVSAAQRKLGTEVAQACTDLRAWTRELESWHWPGTFDSHGPAREKQRMSDMTILSHLSRNESDDLKDGEYWGSLPAFVVQAQEQRLEDICVEFDSIDFEALKAFILAAHNQAGMGHASMDDSIGSIGAATDLKKLDDYTAVITATILQALPYLPKLTRLLETWTIRLSILRSAPRYLRDLKKARTHLNHGWAALAVSHKPFGGAPLTSESLEEMKALISSQVYSLGKRLDRFLDLLEGRPEVVPDAWIDDFEDLEQEYGGWVVRAEKKVLEDEWTDMKEQVRQTALGLARADEWSRAVAERRMPTEPDFDDGPAGLESIGMSSAASDAFGAVLATGSFRHDDDEYYTRRPGSQHAQPAIITTTVTSHSATPSSQSSPTRRRHVPIVIDYSRVSEQADSLDQSSIADSLVTSGRPSMSQSRAPSRTSINAPTATSVRQRAAFLNGDIEKDQSLLKGKSAPIVRPFEHASNAFTRLFKRDSTDSEESRTRFNRQAEDSNKRSMDKENTLAGSLFSGSGSSSKKSSSVSNRNSDRMQYMDMVTAPSGGHPKSGTGDGSMSRGRTEHRNTGNRMAYGDLVMALPVPNRSVRNKSPDSKRAKQKEQSGLQTPARTSYESKRSKSAGSSRGDAMKRFAMELMGSSPDAKRSNRPTAPATESTRMPTSPVAPRIERQSWNHIRREHSAPPRRQDARSELTALPGSALDQGSPQTYRPPIRASQSMKQLIVPATYQPTGFDPSVPPSTEQDSFPPNWPLSATPSEAGDLPINGHSMNDSEWEPDWVQKRKPRHRHQNSVDSEQFEQMFVRTLPDSSAEQRYITTSSNVDILDFGYDTTAARPSSAPGFRAKESRVIVIPPRSSSRGAVPRRPWRADWHSAAMPRAISMVLEEDVTPVPPLPTAADNAAAYFGNQFASTSPDDVSEELTGRAVTTPDFGDEVTTARAEPVVRRASAASTESHSRGDLKAIEIRKSKEEGQDEVKALDIPSPVAGDPSPRPTTPPTRGLPVQDGRPMNFNGEMEFPSPPSSVPGVRTSVRSSASSGLSSQVGQAPDFAAPEVTTSARSLQKRTSLPRTRASNGERDVVNPTTSSTSHDRFDRHVSRVLDKVPAPIRFKTRPGAETPVSRTSVQSKKAERKSMTLAPAESSPKKASPTDPEVKLYHLTQAGRSEPIKLYVRLVGENSERVMVRVGGGWADLADYLRQYAEHHGSRMVSEGSLELQTADSASGKRTSSGPAAVQESKSRSPVPSAVRAFGPTITTKPTDGFEPARTSMISDWGLTQQSKPRLWLGAASDEEDDYERSPQSSTPRSVKANSRPSTATRPDSRGTTVESPGLDGKTRSELPEHKAKWVEGMIEKAMKSASAANTANGVERKEREFGDLGKIGSTRRVVFRPEQGR